MDTGTKKGTLITFEGIDGSGKSSAARALYDALVPEYPVIFTREPGATELGRVLRTLLQNRTFEVDPKAEYLLFAADRAQHMKEIVLPALQENKIVISDRMADSSYAYQGYGRGVDPEMIHTINRWAMKEREPDLTLYLMIDYKEARKRLSERKEKQTVFEQEQELFFKRVTEGFEAAFNKRKDKVIRIDGCRSQEKVHQDIITKVTKFLERPMHETSSSISMDRPSG